MALHDMKQDELKLRHQLEGIELAFQNTDQWLWDLDLVNGQVRIVGSWLSHLGIRPEVEDTSVYLNQLVGKVHPEEREEFASLLQHVLDGKRGRFELKHRFIDIHGDALWTKTQIIGHGWHSEAVERIVAIHMNVHHYFDTMEKLEQLAFTDAVTGMQNRNALVAHMEDRFWKFDHRHVSGTIFLIGLDHFKYANSTYGHYVGDRILKCVGDILKEVSVESEAFYARFESDQFCIVLNETEEDRVKHYATELLKAISQGIQIEEDTYTLTASIGISMFPLHGTTYDELLKSAESALGVSKASGKNKFTIYEYSMNIALIEKWTITQELLCAVDHEELKLVFQPIIRLLDDEIVGFEVLVRWHNNKLGMVPPNRFIPLAEEIGVISAIDYWVLRNGLETIKRINEKYQTHYYVSINISSVHLTDKTFVSHLASILANVEVTPHWLRIEITEHALIGSIAESQQTINRLKAMGVQIYLDDFGTGYSSFNYLKNLPVDVVKLDMSFISDLMKDPQSERLIEGIIQLAHILDLKICAEGIEETAQAQCLKKLSCDLGQGYLYAKPSEEDAICLMIERSL